MSTNLLLLGELSNSLGARLVSNSHDNGFSSVAIDSRNVKEGALFFALSGNNCDGHSFVKSAFSSGASAAVVCESALESFNLIEIAKEAGKDLIVVPNTLKGLQDSARVYLEKFPHLLKIGITGSSGKTTTKEITAAIISAERNTIMNKGNLNSETGLPLSVFEVRGDHEAGVFELGMNRHGEISEIADVLKPNIALVTNIGSAHIEFFGSKEKIVDEKKCIFNFLQNDDTAIVPDNDMFKERLTSGVNAKIKYFGEKCFEELEGTKSLGLEGTEITWAGEKIKFALPGKHNLEDAFAAIAIAKEVCVGNKAIKQGLESVKPLFGRLEILKGRTTVIRDCYNANPESTEKSIEFCDSVDWPGRKAYVIADMLELGESSMHEHQKLGKLLAASMAEKVFLFGTEVIASTEILKKNGRNFFHTNRISDLSAELDKYVKSGDLVLLKGSRGCALERLTEMLTGAN
ncbi:MAG: UDP-N-acetylmuramoyl-tripeptide--D-alanyl-D-alanine ligase [Treponema sp.]|nr:UDP-N-acetylmuramoyl-tripeptide--D-alanyl-D-alanine ligase [Treponema sp.]MCL2237023.1 UDP-N-acetylmuramoyl-tripeptide--D-alanyl-D-alanine ligase [Treponema sp.]